MKQKLKGWMKENRYYLIAFVIPFLTALIAFAVQGVWPFGDRGITIIDSYHQYLPFFSELQYKWKTWDSFFYSWNGGLGMNFWAVMAYYLASPLNLLLIVFPKSLVMECFTLIYLIKLGLGGLTFSWYVRRRFGRYDFSITVFGSMYALSSFVIGYGWNIMWLDCILLFPLVMLGIYELVRRGRGALYGVTLAWCILTNYYIAFMICIFSCIFLVVELVCACEIQVKDVFVRGIKFGVYSLLAGGSAAVFLIPTMYVLKASASATSSFPKTLKFYYSVFELLTQQFSFVEPTNLTGKFNLYAGTILLLLVPVFVFNRNIRWKERIVKVLVAVFLLVCLNTNYLTYIWHGFHFPNGLPGRYSFIYIFMLLIMAYEGYQKHLGCPSWLPSIMAGGWLLFLAYTCWSGKASVEVYTIIVSIVLLFAYGVLMSVVFLRAKQWKICRNLLLLIMGLEAIGYGIFGLCMNGTINRKDYYSDQAMVQSMKKQIELQEEDVFYRVEVEERRGRDDITWHNLPGASLFSSTVNAGVNHILKRVGYFSATNKYSYQGATPETDAFFDISYLISKEQTDSIRSFEYVLTEGTRHLYENKDALGIGFMVSEDILSWDYERTNPFEVINQMMTYAMGEETRPYTYYGLPEPTSEDMALTTNGWADWSYKATQKKDGKVSYTYVADQTQDMYLYFSASHASRVRVEHAGKAKSTTDEDGHIIHVGHVSEGDVVVVTFEMDPAYDSGYIKLIAARHDEDIYNEALQTLSKTTWEIDEKKSDRLSGTIYALTDGLMFTSVPYEEGWTVRVDGSIIEPEIIGEAFIGVRVSEGEHTVEMSYSPKGMRTGAICSLMSSMLLLVIILWEQRGDISYQMRKNAIKH